MKKSKQFRNGQAEFKVFSIKWTLSPTNTVGSYLSYTVTTHPSTNILQKPTNVPCISRIIHDAWREQSNAAVKPGQPDRIQNVVHVTPPSSVSSKRTTGLGEFYEPNAFHSNGNLTAPKKLPTLIEKKWLTARILQLRHSSGSLLNSDQEMAELLKTTILGFFCEDGGSTPVLQPRTQTYMSDTLITELEVQRALDGLNPHKGAGPHRLFP